MDLDGARADRQVIGDRLVEQAGSGGERVRRRPCEVRRCRLDGFDDRIGGKTTF
jgi:hypothetical protein